ncbi:MAG TPA: hypothetical protein VL284_18655 [Thermoanaerobaculia bacterium]|nr:hypothetical protein [Thermoanaerobaculia bacterium]
MRGRSLAAILLLLVAAAALHGSAVAGFWLYDDPALLVEAIREPASGVLFDPAEYTHLAAHTFTPLLVFSFKLDLLLGGLRPAIFYAHQIAALALAGVLMFLLLRRYVDEIFALLGSATFLATWASTYAARTLMIRHYVEGLVFALAALLAWRRSKTLASFFYLLAMLSKEVYAPIPLFFICQSRFEGRSWRQIARELIAPAAAAIVFLAWRWFMTGLTGTYPQSLAPPGDLASLPGKLWIHLVGPITPLWIVIVWTTAIAIVLALFVLRFGGRAIAFIAVTLVVTLLPLLPLTGNFEWRYSFAFVAFSVAAFTVAAGTSGHRWPIAVLAILLITIVVGSLPQRRWYEDLTRNGIAREGEYIWSQPATAPVLGAGSPQWYIDSLRWLREWDHRGEAPRAVFSSYAITLGGVEPVVFVDPVTRTFFGTPAIWQRERDRFDPKLPLTVDFALRNHDAQWQVGPPAAQFVFLTDPGYTAISIPPAGVQRVPSARERQFFRIVRIEQSGHWTASPTLPIPAEGGVTNYRR